MVTLRTGGAAPYIDEGWYTASLFDMEDRPADRYGPQVVWHFRLEDENGDVLTNDSGFDLDFWHFTSQTVGPKSKARPMVEALLSHSIDGMDGDTIVHELEKRMPLSCQVKIADYFAADGEFAGSRVVEGSWLPLDAARPGQQRRAAVRPPTQQQPASAQTAQPAQRTRRAGPATSQAGSEDLSDVPF